MDDYDEWMDDGWIKITVFDGMNNFYFMNNNLVN